MPKTKSTGGGLSRSADRHHYAKLATRVPPEIIKGMTALARDRNTTVNALLERAALQMLADAGKKLTPACRRKLRALKVEP